MAGLITDSPMIPGHEVIGDVVAVGHGEKEWKVGDRVGGPWHGGHDGSILHYDNLMNVQC